jgi:predicted dehydrogenase
MLRVGLIGLGFMGRGHLGNYVRLEKEEGPVKLVAICDIDKSKLEGEVVKGNIETATSDNSLSKYNLYTDIDEMLSKEKIDVLDIALPTYLHAEVAVKALNKGMHVLCEKPMALNVEQCEAMIRAAKNNNKKLMIAQCLRFWPAYEYLKETVDKETYGKVVGAYFFRGGATPKWSYDNWLLDKNRSGGCLMDQHVHDIDMINWLFGKPEMVSTIGKNVIPGSGYDIVSTNYIYSDGKVVNAQDDWTLNGDYGFEMLFRVNFERGNLVFERGTLKVSPSVGQGFIPELDTDDGYYREINYFMNAILNDTNITTATVESTMQTIAIAQKEMESADNKGQFMRI